MTFYGIVFIGGGIFFWYFSFKDADWFIDTRKARPLIAKIGRKPVRMFYMVLGVMLVLVGILALFISPGI
jgi:hypothetical protein